MNIFHHSLLANKPQNALHHSPPWQLEFLRLALTYDGVFSPIAMASLETQCTSRVCEGLLLACRLSPQRVVLCYWRPRSSPRDVCLTVECAPHICDIHCLGCVAVTHHHPLTERAPWSPAQASRARRDAFSCQRQGHVCGVEDGASRIDLTTSVEARKRGMMAF